MGAIRIITDSACDIPVEIAERLSITVVPLSIRFGNDEYVDREGLSPSEFWTKCKESSDLPETAAPSPGAFQASFEAAREAGADGVVCITLSSELSATFQAARAAAETMAPYPVNVVDSRAVTMAQGLLAIDAAEFAATGASFDEVVAHTEHNVPLTGVVGALDTLEQVEIAIEAASSIIFVVNVQEGVVPLDREVAQKLRASGKPILVAINKVDTSLADQRFITDCEVCCRPVEITAGCEAGKISTLDVAAG